MEAPPETVERAKELRRKLTLPEVILWRALRGRKLDGARFRRQHPIGPFILDFYCDEARLTIEVDGSGHQHPDQARYDQQRTEWLEARRVAVLRVYARDVLENLEGVLFVVRQRLRG
jgi:very-short-patch-repair endonuclease